MSEIDGLDRQRMEISFWRREKKPLQNDGECLRFLYQDTRADMDAIHFAKFTSMLLSNSMPF